MDLPRDSASSGDHENQAHVERGLGNDDRDGSTKREAPFPNVAKVRCPPGVTHARGSCSGGGARGEVMRVNSPVRALELVDRGPSRQVSVDLTPENCRCCREDCQCQEHRASSRELVVAAVVEEETLAVPSHTARAFRTSADGVCIVRSAVLVAEVEVTAPVDTKPGEVSTCMLTHVHTCMHSALPITPTHPPSLSSHTVRCLPHPSHTNRCLPLTPH